MSWFVFMLMCLVAYRITRLITLDKITEGFRNWAEDRAENSGADRLAYFITCPWCVGFYVSAFVVAITSVFVTVELYVWQCIAVGCVVGLIGSNLDG